MTTVASYHASMSMLCLQSLPDDVIDRICACLMRHLAGPNTIALLSQSCRRFAAYMSQPAFVSRRWLDVLARHNFAPASELPPPAAIWTLQQLSFAEALQNLGPNRAVFRGDTVLSGSAARIDDFAALMLRHAGVSCCIEGHTWPGMPALMQVHCPGYQAAAPAPDVCDLVAHRTPTFALR